jgi:hypothetical protein
MAAAFDFEKLRNLLTEEQMKVLDSIAMVFCPELNCQEKVLGNLILAHIRDKNHTVVKQINGQSGNYVIKPYCFQGAYTCFPRLIDFDKRNFFMKLSRTQSGTWRSWVYLSGLKKEAAKYRVRPTGLVNGLQIDMDGAIGHIWPVHLVWMTARLQQDTFLSWHLAPTSEVTRGLTLPF